MKNKVFKVAIMFLLCFISYNAKAECFTDNQVVDKDKKWTINFNKEIGIDAINNGQILVTYKNGNNVNAKLELGTDKMSVNVYCPENEYTPGEAYVLKVGENISSKDGKKLKEKKQLNFTIKAMELNYKIGDKIALPYSNEKYSIIDLKKSDIDCDNKEEYVILGALQTKINGIDSENLFSQLCLIVIDANTGYYKANKLIYEIGDINRTNINLTDYNGDKAQQIRLVVDSDQNYVNQSCYIFSCKNNVISEISNNMFTNKQPNFQYNLKYTHIMNIDFGDSDSKYTVDLSKDKEWMAEKLQDDSYKPYIGDGPYFEDVKAEDGSNLLRVSYYISGCYHSDNVATVSTLYKYDKAKGEFVIDHYLVTSQYPVTKIDEKYMYNDDYKKTNGDIEIKLGEVYCDEYGKRFIGCKTFKMCGADEAVEYERKTGEENLQYEEDGSYFLYDDYFDMITSDNFTLPVSTSCICNIIDYSKGGINNYTQADFYDLLNHSSTYKATLSNGKIIKLQEEYRP